MAETTKEAVLEALQTISPPGNDADIVSIGLIKGLMVKDGHVAFTIEATPEQSEALIPVRDAAEAVVRDLAGVLSVTAVLTAERAPPPQQAPRGGGAAEAKPALPGIKHVVAVASGKGGVGKSTVAVNLALGMAANGLAVGLLDADIYGPSVPRMMGISGRPKSVDGKIIEPMTGFGLKCMSMGFLIDEETPMIWRGPMVQGALEQMMRDVSWGELDVMIVDMPPGTGDAQLTMAQRVPLAGAVIVSTPQDIALLDARKGLNMFRRVDVPVFGIVENMSYFLCPGCGERSEIFGHGGARDTAAKLGVDFLGEIPLHMEIRETSDGGQPVVVSRPDGAHARIFRDIAARVAERLATAGAGERPAPQIVVD